MTVQTKRRPGRPPNPKTEAANRLWAYAREYGWCDGYNWPEWWWRDALRRIEDEAREEAAK